MKFLLLALFCGVAVAEVFFEERFNDGGKSFDIKYRRSGVLIRSRGEFITFGV